MAVFNPVVSEYALFLIGTQNEMASSISEIASRELLEWSQETEFPERHWNAYERQHWALRPCSVELPDEEVALIRDRARGCSNEELEARIAHALERMAVMLSQDSSNDPYMFCTYEMVLQVIDVDETLFEDLGHLVQNGHYMSTSHLNFEVPRYWVRERLLCSDSESERLYSARPEAQEPSRPYALYVSAADVDPLRQYTEGDGGVRERALRWALEGLVTASTLAG